MGVLRICADGYDLGFPQPWRYLGVFDFSETHGSASKEAVEGPIGKNAHPAKAPVAHTNTQQYEGYDDDEKCYSYDGKGEKGDGKVSAGRPKA